jgi:hypothetical protein
MNAHEYYVSLEVAKLLKEAGFDWELNSRWQDWGGKNSHEFILKTDLFYTDRPAEYDGFHALPAPTLDVAQRWLREVKNIWVEVLLVNATDPHYRVDLVNASRHDNPYGILHDADYNEYEIPERAQEAGIKKALEVILEKGE